MQMTQIIEKKRDGHALTREEIAFFVTGVTRGDIPDYQASALLMAICIRGMDARETADLTDCMTHSGQVVDLSALGGHVADKHSTGGVGDTTSIALVPLVAACGVKVAKMSGRGLGHTGGTVDKLESIPGYRTEMGVQELIDLVRAHGAAIVGQSGELAPADRKLYALRDVTGTVESIPLIASSIMSKKLASGTDVIVLDVKAGSGAFMKEADDAFALAKAMVEIGTHLNRRVSAIVTDMDQPLGRSVGNAMDVREAIELLKGQHKGSDLWQVCMALGVQMLLLCEVESSEQAARQRLQDAIDSGAALQKLQEIIAAQGGDARVCEDCALLGHAAHVVDLRAQTAGYIVRIDALRVGLAAQLLGAGRERLDDRIDPLAGIWMHCRVGDWVEAGTVLAQLHVNDRARLPQAQQMLHSAIAIGPDAPAKRPLFLGVVDADGVHKYQ